MSARILLDVDGPLTRGFFDAACEELRRRGVEAWPHDIRQWNIFECFGVAGTSVERECYAALGVPGRCLAFEPNRGAREFVEWCRARAETVAVTAPLSASPTWERDRGLWLADRLAFDAEHVVFSHDKRHEPGDVFVDDHASSVEAWQAEHPGALAVLWMEAHNRGDVERVRAAGIACAREYEYLKHLIRYHLEAA